MINKIYVIQKYALFVVEFMLPQSDWLWGEVVRDHSNLTLKVKFDQKLPHT